MTKDEPQLASALPADILKLLDQPAEVEIVRLMPGTPARGKLSDHDVRAIRASTGSLAEVAKVYGVSRWTVSMIRTGKLRKNV